MENYEEKDVISFEEAKEDKEISFEESLEELESIVNRLESGDVPLDDAINEFNRAMILVKACDEYINQWDSGEEVCYSTISNMFTNAKGLFFFILKSLVFSKGKIKILYIEKLYIDTPHLRHFVTFA